jgi:peptidoglycan/xylan/chitin deacetylase (PgdA/CDA1 family)
VLSEAVTATTATPLPAASVPPTLPPATVPSPTVALAPVVTVPVTTRPRPTIPHYSADAAPVALTFDDGPNESFTPQVLDILARYGVRATFFVVGAEVDRLPDLTRRLVNDGHVLGNHTWDHADLTTLDEDGFRAQIDRTEDLLATFTGHRSSCARPPYGRINQYARDQLNARGMRATRWSTDTGDWKRPGADEIVRRAVDGARPGAVILLHDGGPDMSQTVAALPRIIEGMRSRGLRFAPICS